jgi:hypothetical protein
MTPQYRQSNDAYKSRNKKYDDTKKKFGWHWSISIGLMVGLAGVVGALYIWQFTLISLGTLLLIAGIAGALAFVLQWKVFYSPRFIEKHSRIHLGIYAVYNFIGIGFFVTALILALNLFGASDEIKVESHKIVGKDKRYLIDAGGYIVLLLENDAYADEPEMRAVPYTKGIQHKVKPYLQIGYREGLFGFRIFHGIRMSKTKGLEPEQVEVEDVKDLLDSLGVNVRDTIPIIHDTISTSDTVIVIDSLAASDSLN